MGKISRIIALFFFMSSIHAQKIEGTTKDNLGNVLASVSVFLLRNDSIVEVTKTNNEGLFQFQKAKMGDVVKFSHLDYSNQVHILHDFTNLWINMDKINTEEHSEFIYLDQVNIQNKVIVKKDTVSFKASQFLIGNEQNTEDLLKKIPGVSVDGQGKITVQGKEIERIMVEGDDLLRKNYKFLSRGLNPEAIEDVELHYNDEENSLLRGMNIEKKYAINLKLKDQYKNILFGDAEVGNDFGKRYRANSTLMHIKKRAKTYISGVINNIGEDLSQINYQGNLGDYMNADLNNPSLDPIISVQNKVNMNDKERFNFNNNKFLSFNNLLKISDKTNLKTNSQLVFDQLSFHRLFNQNYFGENEELSIKDDFQSKTKVVNSSTVFELTSKLTTRVNLQSFVGFNYGMENTETNQLYNNQSVNQSLHNKSINFQQRNILTFRGKKDSVVNNLLSLISYEKLPQEYDYFKENNSLVYQRLDLEKYRNTLEFQKRIKLGNRLYHFILGSNYQKNKLITNLNADDLAESNRENALIMNDFYITNKFSYKKNKYNLGANLKLSYQVNESNHLKNHHFSINPNAFIRYELKTGNFIELKVNSSLQQIAFNDVLGFYKYTAINILDKGVEEITLFRNSRASLQYTSGNFNKLTTFNLGLNLQKTNGGFINDVRFFNHNVYNNLLVNNKETTSFSLFGDVDSYLKIIKSSIKLKSFFSTNNGYFLSDNKLQDYRSSTLNLELNFASGFNSIVNFSLSNKLNLNTINSIYNKTNHSLLTNLELFFSWDKVTLSSKINRTYISETKSELYFFDTDLKYIVNPKVQLAIKGRNLFNEKKFVVSALNMNNELNTIYNINPRYLLFSIKYTLN